LKTLPVLQKQLDALLEFDVSLFVFHESTISHGGVAWTSPGEVKLPVFYLIIDRWRLPTALVKEVSKLL